MIIKKNILASLMIIIFLCIAIHTLQASDNKFEIIFDTPKDGEIIKATSTNVTKILCRGKVKGKIKPDYKVQVKIFTDKWYPQGTSSIDDDGIWRINPIYLGGIKHTVQARLLNKKDEVLCVKSIIVHRRLPK